jgi:tetratricopeptide (TPR) repeat protein
MQAMETESSIQGLLQKAYESLKASDAPSAVAALEEALRLDFEHPEVVYALKCVNWWLERVKRLGEIQGCYDQGEYLLSQWKSFYGFLDRIGYLYDRCLYAVRRYVFSIALTCFQRMLADTPDQPDGEILLRVGRCYKGVGNYEQALKYLEEAVSGRRDDAEALAELADVYALIDESRPAKALFREAFFSNPQRVALQSLESELILLLGARVRELGYRSPELEEWIPVYGVLLGVFSVKRELRAIELGKLKQSIFSLENEFRERPGAASVLTPRLINRYFWLIDHYVNVGEDSTRIDETLLKIKVLDPVIYERYIN